jgi:lysophospholipase L1-like esterase
MIGETTWSEDSMASEARRPGMTWLKTELQWRNLRSTLAVVAVTLVLFGIGAEILLRATCSYCTWTERNGRPYRSPYEASPQAGWYHTRRPNQTTAYDQPEFNFEVKTNTLGIRDIEHPVAKPADAFRIVGIGDSFTEGQGAAYEDGYLKVLERNLDAETAAPNVTVIVGGVAGSDPVYGYKLLEDKLLAFAPDLVTVTVNNSDVSDLITRGGEERFQDGGSIRYAEPPGDEWLFEHSHLYRFVAKELLGYGWLGLSRSERKRRQAQALAQIAETLGDFQDLAQREGFAFVTILHPDYNEFLKKRYAYEAEDLKAQLDAQGIPYFDLLAWFEQSGVLDNEKPEDLYWTNDFHNNAHGYARFAEGLETYLHAHNLIPVASGSKVSRTGS